MMCFLSYFFWDWSLFSWNHYYFGYGSERLSSCWWSNYRGLQRIISSLSHQFRPILIAIATQLSWYWSKPLQGSVGDFHMHVSWLILMQPVLQNLWTSSKALTFERWGKERSVCHNNKMQLHINNAPVIWINSRAMKCNYSKETKVLSSKTLCLLFSFVSWTANLEAKQLMVSFVFLKTWIFFENK